MNDIYAKQYAEAQFAEALKALREYKYELTIAQMQALATVVHDLAESMTSVHGLLELEDATESVIRCSYALFAPPEQLSVYGRTE